MSESDEDRLVMARRKFLKAAIYAAPVIATTVSVNKAHAQQVSCGPASCSPNGGPCGPDNCPPQLVGCPPIQP
jgi:hypothetical protein